ncbi:LiaI-LiaF-like domain-containing protein [Pedobacter sp. SYSU D00535]|uniref:LiaF transmembrane domain-containing protein n=1 Tax=Pedobacter sp. SYSU D00535 TaxID=2810308 RepID=UPI001A9604E1|nr:DUF5668 domain-containing protein [Pedobacter sp. SYSU D00535]
MDNTHFEKRRGKGKKWIGIIFLLLGTIMLSRSLGLFIPDWLISWPTALIAIGFFTGSRHQFRNPASYILIIIGSIFLLDRMIPYIDLGDFVFPLIIMGLGLYLLTGRNRRAADLHRRQHIAEPVDWDRRVNPEDATGAHTPPVEPVNPTYEDYLDTVSIFGGVKKTIVSKNFRGGEIVTVMGGAEINLSQADIITPTVTLDVTQVFGGTKIIIPPHWKVSSDLVAVFGGIEDKRQLMTGITPSDEKHLIIKGTSIFGGIDIRSF